MVVIPVAGERSLKRTVVKDQGTGQGRTVFTKITDQRSTRYWIALVYRDDVHKFTLLRKCVVPYNEPNPGERSLRILAKEFGVPDSQIPAIIADLAKLRPDQVEGFQQRK